MMPVGRLPFSAVAPGAKQATCTVCDDSGIKHIAVDSVVGICSIPCDKCVRSSTPLLEDRVFLFQVAASLVIAMGAFTGILMDI